MTLKKIQLTENQLKVIKDKYLKDSPTVEDWLEMIAENIALPEILFSDPDYEELFKDVHAELNEYESDGKTFKQFILHKASFDHNERGKNFEKFMKNLTALSKEKKYSKKFQEAKKTFYSLLSNFEFLPNSPTLMNAGRRLQQLSACYVLPVGDSIEEIYESVKNMAIIHKSGGGTGFSFSRLRPAEDEVLSTKGISSGPMSFMGIFDKSTEVVKQGGTRRGANMGILRYDHPDVLRFIEAKKTSGVLENFNISVAIDDYFMQCVKNNADYALINPRDKSVVKTVNAKEVYRKLVQGAWETGDPGIIIIDRINNSSSNTTPAMGQIESTNPCGEQPLLPYEPCNLGSINLSKFVEEDGVDFDWERLKQCVFDSVHFLDNVIDINNYPLRQIELLAKSNRRIGLGVMGWAESLVMLGLPYNSEEAIKKAEQVMQFINEKALDASEELAKERGVFPNWKNSAYDPDGQYFRGEKRTPRHCARTTIAPTGTIGITAGLQGAGIEPFFAVVYTRYNAAGIDALKKGETPAEKDTFFEVNPLFKRIAEKHRHFGFPEEELWKKIDQNHKSLVGIKEIPVKIQNLFLTSHDLAPLDHVKVQCAFQKYTDNAVSKTVNLKNEATIADVDEVYMKAYEWGAKGITIYRDGSKSFQVLNIKEQKKKKKESEFGELSSYYEVQTGQGSLHIHINYDEDGPTKLFCNLSPTGTEISGLVTALSILISKFLEAGGEPEKLLKHLNSIKGDKPFGFGPKRIDSIPHAISKVLRNHLIMTGKLQQMNGQTMLHEEPQKTLEKPQMYCPKCFSTNVEMSSGCSEPTCFDCGYSKCS
ncbi:adenosylcobalamin-dependent ribonucleoside-diphosphate reductase [Candidatus Woesearchaeota archaeon]|nr:MAG: adenosylcobalamin-dependent ribonucleoside-diphosphate reductase [Candidatus Woesearchaeota archaeon]